MKKRAIFGVAALVTASLFANFTSAHATTNVAGDASSDNGSGYDSRGDITTFGGDYRDDLVTLSVHTRSPTNPATDPNWISYSTGIIWDLDTNGDSDEEFSVFVTNIGGSVYSTVRRASDFTKLCDGTPSFDAGAGMVFSHFPASCIGTPSGFTLRTFFTYQTAGTSSGDFAPSYNTFGAAVTRTVTTAPPPPPPPPPPPVDPPITAAGLHDGYWMLTSAGGVYGFGTAIGVAVPLSSAVHIEPNPTGKGYWVLNALGQIAAKGDAPGFAPVALGFGEKAVSLSSTPTGKGAWVFTDKGRVIALGDAVPKGDMSGTALNGPILGSVATPTGLGYWMVGSDGGIFSFGDAAFHGSTGAMTLNKPVMAMAPSPDGSGYWLVASDGGIFAFDVPFYGSMGATPLNKPVSGMVPGAKGYLMVAEDGGVFAFGNVPFHGSLGANPPPSPVVSVALQP